MEQAIRLRDMEKFEMIYDRGLGYESARKAMYIAASIGNLEVMKCLYEYNPSLCHGFVMTLAIRMGQLHVVRWIHETNRFIHQFHINQGVLDICRVCTQDGVQQWYGHLHVLKWLHDHGYYLTIEAIYEAITNGYLLIVKFLYKVHSPVSSQFHRSIVKVACETGHLDIVRWLYVMNPKASFSKYEEHWDYSYSLGIMQWMYYNNLIWNVEEAIEAAIVSEDLPVVQWLIENNQNVDCKRLSVFAHDLVYMGETRRDIADWIAAYVFRGILYRIWITIKSRDLYWKINAKEEAGRWHEE